MTIGELVILLVGTSGGGAIGAVLTFWIKNKLATAEAVKLAAQATTDAEDAAAKRDTEVEDARIEQVRQTQIIKQDAFNFMEGKFLAHFESQRTEIAELRTGYRKLERDLARSHNENIELRDRLAAVENEAKARVYVLDNEYLLLNEKHKNALQRAADLERREERRDLRERELEAECADLRKRVLLLERQVSVKVIEPLQIEGAVDE